jgi:hypothetical protein
MRSWRIFRSATCLIQLDLRKERVAADSGRGEVDAWNTRAAGVAAAGLEEKAAVRPRLNAFSAWSEPQPLIMCPSP